jgi:predicted RNA-binding Zn-ribbon protein involved in translation (DUF1610 family)
MPSMPLTGQEANDLAAYVEIICPDCGYHLARSLARLRRDTPIACPNCGKEIAELGGPEPDNETPV